MTKRHKTKQQAAEAAEAPEAAEVADTPQASEHSEGDGAGATVQQPEAEGSPEAELEEELEELKDRHLRLAAEYDNYRKRILRERAELKGRLQADLARMMLDAIDDLTRVTEVDVGSASARDIIAGVELVERKIMKELEAIGLGRVGAEGEPFDPNEHEAVGTETALRRELEGTIATVLQPGYTLGDLLVRPARVRVYVRPDDPEAE
jgi:molecular chaperone GrpE